MNRLRLLQLLLLAVTLAGVGHSRLRDGLQQRRRRLLPSLTMLSRTYVIDLGQYGRPMAYTPDTPLKTPCSIFCVLSQASRVCSTAIYLSSKFLTAYLLFCIFTLLLPPAFEHLLWNLLHYNVMGKGIECSDDNRIHCVDISVPSQIDILAPADNVPSVPSAGLERLAAPYLFLFRFNWVFDVPWEILREDSLPNQDLIRHQAFQNHSDDDHNDGFWRPNPNLFLFGRSLAIKPDWRLLWTGWNIIWKVLPLPVRPVACTSFHPHRRTRNVILLDLSLPASSTLYESALNTSTTRCEPLWSTSLSEPVTPFPLQLPPLDIPDLDSITKSEITPEVKSPPKTEVGAVVLGAETSPESGVLADQVQGPPACRTCPFVPLTDPVNQQRSYLVISTAAILIGVVLCLLSGLFLSLRLNTQSHLMHILSHNQGTKPHIQICD